MVKPYKKMRVTELSLLEATREEYITRHSVDGRIIYADHRLVYFFTYTYSSLVVIIYLSCSSPLSL